MTRPAAIMLGVGALGAIAWSVLAASGEPVMPSYLAAWLFCLSLPLGALPLLMGFELLGIVGWPIVVPLRRLLVLQPLAMLFALPVLLRGSVLYARPGLHRPPAADLLAPGLFAGRMIVMLLIWTGLCLVFLRPAASGPRRRLAAAGLLLHFAIGSIAAVDWIMLLDPGLASSAFGLLTIILQSSIALCAAILALALASIGRAMPREATPLLLAALGCWMFLHFTQFLIVWSANLPTEIVWYQHRSLGVGEAVPWFGFTAAILALLTLLPHRLARTPWIAAAVAAMLLLVHLVEMLWLVTPGFRGRFTVSLADCAAMIGLVALSAGFLQLRTGSPRHDPV